MTQAYQTHPRIRAFGRARLDIAGRIKTQWDWDRLWKEPANHFPFNFDAGWKQCVEYRVDDFAAEIGFLIDILGLQVHAISPDYAMFTSPGGDFYISVASAEFFGSSTPPEAIRIQFMLADLLETVRELEQRGVDFEQQPQPCATSSTLYMATFRTPHGIPVDLWGEVQGGKPDESWRETTLPESLESEESPAYGDQGGAWPEAGNPAYDPLREDFLGHHSGHHYSVEERSQEIPEFLKKHLGPKRSAGSEQPNKWSGQVMPSSEEEPDDETPATDPLVFGFIEEKQSDRTVFPVEDRPERNSIADEFNSVDEPEMETLDEEMDEANLPQADRPQADLPEGIQPDTILPAGEMAAEERPETEPDEEDDLLDDPFAYLDEPEEEHFFEEPSYEDIDEEHPDEDLPF